MSFLPVRSWARQKFLHYRTLEDDAEKDICVGQSEVMPLPKALYLQGQFDLVTGTHNISDSIADELGKVVAPTLENIDTRAYLIRNAVIGNNRVSTATSIKDLSLQHANSRPFRINEELDTAALCSTWQGNDYFAHFLFDDAAMYPLARDFGEPFFSGMGLPRTAHCIDYLSRFGFAYAEKEHISVRQLWMFRDFSLGPDKRRRLQHMAARTKAAQPAASPYPGAFIRRGVKGQTRELDNAAEIEAWCAAQGFVIVDPEHQTVDEICAALNGVPLIIGVEGSHLVHGLFNMAEGGTMICIQPADRFNVIFRHLCAALNLRWGFVVAKGTIEGFHLELDHLKATLDLVQEPSACDRTI